VGNEFTEAALKPLAVHELIQIADRIERIISAKLSEEKRALKLKLSLIEKYEANGSGTRKTGPDEQATRSPARRSKAVPKYRDPGTGLTWSGRGMTPRWLAAAISEGMRKDDFLIRPESGPELPPAANGGNGSSHLIFTTGND